MTYRKIKHIRELNNYTQSHIASQLGITTQAYRKLESGETRLTVAYLENIAKIFSMDAAAILKFDPLEANSSTTHSTAKIDQTIEAYERLIATKDKQIETLTEFNQFLKNKAQQP